MDNYNPDLILDLAAGLLPDDEAQAAEAALTPEGRAELEAQRAVMAAIAAEGPVAMTDIERARLHRSVSDGIAATTRELSPVEIARPRTPARSARWFRWASAATAAALFVGVVAVGSQLTGLGGSDSASDATSAPVNADIQAGGEGSAETTAPAAALSTTTMAFMAGDSLTEDIALPEVRSTSARDDLTNLALELQEAQRFSPPQQQDLTALSCYEEASEDLAIVDWSFATYVNAAEMEVDAIAYAILDGDGDKLDVRLYALATCLPIDTE